MKRIELEPLRYGDRRIWRISVVSHGVITQISLPERYLTELATLIKRRHDQEA